MLAAGCRCFRLKGINIEVVLGARKVLAFYRVLKKYFVFNQNNFKPNKRVSFPADKTGVSDGI